MYNTIEHQFLPGRPHRPAPSKTLILNLTTHFYPTTLLHSVTITDKDQRIQNDITNLD